MDKIVLGRTGLEVSVASLGAGGRSRIGQSTGASFDQSVAIVKAAIDRGVTMIDTAARYGTEPIVGAALQGIRDESSSRPSNGSSRGATASRAPTSSPQPSSGNRSSRA